MVLLGGLLLQVDDLLSIQSVNAICLPENYRLNVCTVQPFLCFSSVVPWHQFSYFPALNSSRENSFLSSACIKKKNPIHDTLCGAVGRGGGGPVRVQFYMNHVLSWPQLLYVAEDYDKKIVGYVLGSLWASCLNPHALLPSCFLDWRFEQLRHLPVFGTWYELQNFSINSDWVFLSKILLPCLSF